MVTLDVHAADGGTAGTVDLDSAVFEAPVNVPVMHQVVVAQLAAARQGSSKTKNRSEVRGGGSKPWRQKGTGRARQGSIRSPQWAGGGVAHGPDGQERYAKRVPKKLKRIALRSALSDRAASGDVRVVEQLGFDAPRTKDALALLDRLGLAGRRVLLVVAGWDANVVKSFRNLGKVHVLRVDQLNTYDVLCSDVVVLEQPALDLVGTGRYAGQEHTEEVAPA